MHYLSELRFALITSSESCTLRTVSSRPDTQLRSALNRGLTSGRVRVIRAPSRLPAPSKLFRCR